MFRIVITCNYTWFCAEPHNWKVRTCSKFCFHQHVCCFVAGLEVSENRMLRVPKYPSDMWIVFLPSPSSTMLATMEGWFSERTWHELKPVCEPVQETEVYKSYLKAWRLALDADNSNRCTWPEFQAACRKIGILDIVKPIVQHPELLNFWWFVPICSGFQYL